MLNSNRTRSIVPRAAVFRHRGFWGALILIPCGLTILASRPTLSESSLLARTLNVAGWAFFFLYATTRIWATLYIGGRKDHELQVEGPYSVCRHPLYFGSLCFALSVACFLKSLTFTAALGVLFLVYFKGVVSAEEKQLELLFQQDYRNYRLRTPSLWPRFSRYSTPKFVPVEIKRLRDEMIRLWCAAIAAVALELALQLRIAPWWPHWFQLP